VDKNPSLTLHGACAGSIPAQGRIELPNDERTATQEKPIVIQQTDNKKSSSMNKDNTLPSSLKEEILAKHLGWDRFLGGPVMADTKEILAAMEEYVQQLSPGTSDAGIIKGEFLNELFEAGIVSPLHFHRAVKMIQKGDNYDPS
jgi:hypothetical protein